MSGFELDQTMVPAAGAPALALATGGPFAIGSQVAGRYRIVRFIAAGASGEVYEVDDLVLGTRIALKLMKRDEQLSRLAIQRLIREISLARKVTHRNVCRVHDVGEHAGRAFLTMEYLVGETLADRLQRGPLAPSERDRVARDLIAGLAALHAQCIVHRDFKSSNVIVTSGEGGERAVITDFGLAKSTSIEAGADLTGGATLLGTPAYMAPEQVEARPATFASDIYALGVVLFEIVTGTLPFREATALGTAAARLTHDAPRASSRVAHVPRRWDDAIAHCLERDPLRRPATVRDVFAPLHRHRVLWALAAVAAIGAMGGAIGLASDGVLDPARRRAPDGEAATACATAASKLVGIWDPPTRARIAARFETNPKQFVHSTWRTLGAQFDAMTAEWARLWTRACAEGDRTSDPLLYGQRLSCLESRRIELRSYASALANPAIDVETFALGAPPQFPITPPDACTEEPFLRGQVPLPPIAARPAIEALMIDFHQLRADARLATFQGSIDPDPVLAALTGLEQRARALGYPAGEAEIEFWHGEFLTWFGRSGEAARVADGVIALAEQTRDDPSLIMGLALKVGAATADPGPYDGKAASAALTRATQIAARLGSPRHLLEWIEEARVEHMLRLHDPGIASRQRLVELRDGYVNYQLWARGALAFVRAWNGEAAGVLAETKAILDERERFSGPWSIDLGTARLRLSIIFALTGDIRGALAQTERAVTVLEPAFRDHRGDALWAAHVTAAGYATRLGAVDVAERHVRAAVHDLVAKGASEASAYARSIRKLRERGERRAAELALRMSEKLQRIGADDATLLTDERLELAAEAGVVMPGAAPSDPDRATLFHARDLIESSSPGDGVTILADLLARLPARLPWATPIRGDVEAWLGIALVEARNFDAAIRHLEEAIWIHGSCCAATAAITQDARLALARALWARGDRANARHHAMLARTILATMGPALAEKARAADAWVAAHPEK